MMMSIREFLLFQSYVSKSPPCIVMVLVGFQCILVTLFAIFEILVGNELVTTKSMSICEILIELNCSTKKLQSCFMFLLKTVAITNHAPCLWGKERFLKCKIAQVDKRILLLIVPKTCRVKFKTFKPIWFQFAHLFVSFLCLVKLCLLK